MLALIECCPTKAEVKTAETVLASFAEDVRNKILKNEEVVFNELQKTLKSAMTCYKAISAIHALMLCDEEDTGDDSDTDFRLYCLSRLHIQKSTAYEYKDAYEVWKDYDLAAIKVPFPPSNLTTLCSKRPEYQRLRDHIYKLAIEGNIISVQMARNAKALLRSDIPVEKITLAAMRNPDKLLGRGGEEDKPEVLKYKAGTNIEVKIICKGERPEDSVIIDELNKIIQQLSGVSDGDAPE